MRYHYWVSIKVGRKWVRQGKLFEPGIHEGESVTIVKSIKADGSWGEIVGSVHFFCGLPYFRTCVTPASVAPAVEKSIPCKLEQERCPRQHLPPEHIAWSD